MFIQQCSNPKNASRYVAMPGRTELNRDTSPHVSESAVVTRELTSSSNRTLLHLSACTKSATANKKHVARDHYREEVGEYAKTVVPLANSDTVELEHSCT
jgi:hypothetical protein